MFLAFGWAVIQSSHEVYVDANHTLQKLDDIDDELNEADKKLFEEFESWLKSKNISLFDYKFTRYMNNHSGLFQFHTSKNHRSQLTLETMEFISRQSKGSYGLVHIHEDEKQEFEFEVWRILDGKVTCHSDPFFSPFSSNHAFGGTNFWMKPDA